MTFDDPTVLTRAGTKVAGTIGIAHSLINRRCWLLAVQSELRFTLRFTFS